MTDRLAALSPAAKRALLARARQRQDHAPILAPLSFHQQPLWLRHQLTPDSPIDTMGYAWRVTGVWRVELLPGVMQALMQRHTVLRTTFRLVHEVPMQVIAPSLPVPLQVYDLSALPPPDQDAAIRSHLHTAAHHTFDLTAGPLLRMVVLRCSYDTYVLCCSIHHIVVDGWSIGVLLRDMLALYEALAHNQPASLPTLPLHYHDYARWQHQDLHGETLQRLVAYWTQQLQDVPLGLRLPITRPHAIRQGHQGAMVPLDLPPDLLEALRALSRAEGVTLFMLLCAALSLLLYRLSGQEEILIGTPVAGREYPGTSSLMGMFVNVVVLRASLGGDPPLREFLQRVRERTLAALAHQALPFEKLVEALHPARDASQQALQQVAFNLQPAVPARLERAGLLLDGELLDNGMAELDLSLSLWEGATTLRGHLRYHTAVFEEATITRLAAQLQTLLRSMVAHPEQRLSALPLLPEAERLQLTVTWNATQTAAPPDTACLQTLVEAQVARTPEAVAVLSATETLTYQELNQRANRLAHHLRTLGVGPEVLVGLHCTRTPAMIVGLLAILKAGGAYVPLDPALPAARLAMMLADADPAVVLASSPLAPGLPALSCPVVSLDAIHPGPDTNLASGVQAQHLAYVLYTSGSTGVPKGVMIEHRSVVNVVQSFVRTYHLTSTDRVLQQASLGFDVAVNEIFPILSVGGTVVLPQPEDNADDTRFLALLARHQITILGAVPHVLARWNAMAAPLPHVRLILSGGAALAWRDVERLCQTITVTNGYGPTEATVCATCFDVRHYDPTRHPSLPIGTPLANMQAYIVDQHLACVPIGVPGELCLSGVGLAQGYWRDAALTAEKFVPHPYRPGERLYRTGDLARWLLDGQIEFLGRLDHQVKLRGVRIEVEEIEALLRQHPLVDDAVVRLWEYAPDNQHLVAYVLAAQALDASLVPDLQRLVRLHLPIFMRPAVFVCLDAFPRLPNGKVHRHGLPTPPPPQQAHSAPHVPPSTPLEQALAAIWCDVLHLEQVSVHDDFFALGGHSLLAVQLMARVQDTLDVTAPVTLLLEAPTIAQLASRLTTVETAETATVSPLVPLQTCVSSPTLFCVHPIDGQIHWYTHLAARLATSWAVYGLRARVLPGAAGPSTTLAALVSDYVHVIRQADPQGPYVLCGFSSGGLFALALAAALEQQGYPVQSVTLVDTYTMPVTPDALYRLSWDDLLLLVRGVLEESYPAWRTLWEPALESTTLPALLWTLPPQEALEALCDWLDQRQIASSGLRPLLQQHLTLSVAHAQLLSECPAQRLRAPIQLYQATELPRGQALGAVRLNGHEYTSGPVHTHILAGSHYQLMRPPWVDALVLHWQYSLATGGRGA